MVERDFMAPPREIIINHDVICDDDDGDDLSLLLYVGVENDQHRLAEVLPYRDLSAIPFAEVAVVANDPEKQGIFPVLLHHMLASDLYSDSIMWFPHGRAFAIVNVDKFFAEVCQLYFCTSDQEMFMWWMKTYGFKQVAYYDGQKEMSAFFHERFLRYRPWLAFTMKPSGHDGIRSHQSAEHNKELFWELNLFPPLQESMIPSSPHHHIVHTPVAYNYKEKHSQIDGSFATMNESY